jgi:hypothetical protein
MQNLMFVDLKVLISTLMSFKMKLVNTGNPHLSWNSNRKSDFFT